MDLSPAGIVALGTSGGVIAVLIIALFKFCYKKELYTKCKSNCCETVLEIEDNSSPVKPSGDT
jgi:hypothetical protein